MKEAAKKARERAYLERFRENFADFPEGEVVSFGTARLPDKDGIAMGRFRAYRVPRSGTRRGPGLSDASTGRYGG